LSTPDVQAPAAAPVDPQALLDALTGAGEPLTPAQLAERLSLQTANAPFEAAVEALEREGRIVRNRAGLLLVAARVNLLSGQVQGHRDGFGFLLRDDRGADLVLSEHEMSKVLHGDRVLARARGNDRRGRPEGEIVEVIERRTNRLVGRFLNERGVSIVVPEDQRIQHDILVPAGATLSAEHGQVVVVEIVQQPQRYVQPVGRVVEVLGAIDDPGMEIEIAVRKFAVPHVFTDAALQEAGSLPREVRPGDLAHRVDLRDVPLVTIDGEDARDFDDAVYCEPMPGRGRGWRLLVAIADVSHYVSPGCALDVDAQARSTSVYFPRRVIPMLPEELSNGLCSLNPQVDRLALVCDMVVSAKGDLKAYQFYPAVIHSAARLTYDEVWDALSVPGSRAAEKLAPVAPSWPSCTVCTRCWPKRAASVVLSSSRPPRPISFAMPTAGSSGSCRACATMRTGSSRSACSRPTYARPTSCIGTSTRRCTASMRVRRRRS
jgi:ribonuclease R